jgi:hypothetical protein
MQNSHWADLKEKLVRPFPAPRRFGWIRVWHDESNRSFALALLIAILIFIGVLVFSRPPGDTGRAGLAAVSIEQVTLGESDESLDLLDERTESVAVHATATRSSLAEGGAVVPQAPTLPGELRIDVPQSTAFDASSETKEVAAAVQGLQDSVKKLKREPVQLGGSGGISGALEVDARYNSVVYVIDKSTSMGADYRLERVKQELIAGIQGLKEHQKFSVVFFDQGFLPMGSSDTHPFRRSAAQSLRLMVATEAKKNEAESWIRGIQSGGGTDPVPATLHALAANPELVILLSDGEFHQEAVTQITDANQRKNRKQARIDCIGIGEIVQTLQQIAQDNKGHYQPAR